MLNYNVLLIKCTVKSDEHLEIKIVFINKSIKSNKVQNGTQNTQIRKYMHKCNEFVFFEEIFTTMFLNLQSSLKVHQLNIINNI